MIQLNQNTTDLQSILDAVNALPEATSVSGTISITENGTHDVARYATANVNVQSAPVLLWTNASPPSTYGGGTIHFDGDYDGYIIECAESRVYAVSSLFKHNKGFVPANAQSAAFAASWNANNDYCYYGFRKVTTTRNSITFNSIGQSSGAGGNTQKAIPLNIWGVKFTL